MLVVAVFDRVVIERPPRFLGERRLSEAVERTHGKPEYTRAVNDLVLVLDAARSRVRIHTFAEGLLARLAHDLELVCGELSGSASRRVNGGATAGTAVVVAPLRGFSVGGVLAKDGRVDEGALSPTERRDILAKMRADVFRAGPDGVVSVEVDLDAGAARVRVVPPNGKAVELVVRPDLRAEGDSVRATGAFELSLKAIGSAGVKGPMGAFRVKDGARVSFDVVFSPPTAG